MIDLNDYKVKLMKNHKYPAELAEEIAMVADSICEMYGEEHRDMILEAIDSCNIAIRGGKKIYENCQTVLNKKGFNSDNSFASCDFGDTKTAMSVYASLPVFKDGKIVDVRRIIVLPKDWMYESHRQFLVNSLLHLVRSYANEYTYCDGTLIRRDGTCTTTCNVSFENGGQKFDSTVTSGYGLENGLITYHEIRTMHDYTDCYDTSKYTFETAIASALPEQFAINLTNSTLNGMLPDTQEVTYLIDLMDRIYDNLTENGKSEISDLYSNELSRCLCTIRDTLIVQTL